MTITVILAVITAVNNMFNGKMLWVFTVVERVKCKQGGVTNTEEPLEPP